MPESEVGITIGIPKPYIKERSREILSNTIRDRKKMSSRRELMSTHPEERIRIDKWKLKQIVNFFDFKCHPDCSVARGVAIRHSDIDLGLVVCRKPVDEETQQRFVDELRRQGFEAYTEKELAQARETEQLINNRGNLDFEELRKAMVKRGKIENRVITFKTKLECIRMTREPLNALTAVYVAGKSI